MPDSESRARRAASLKELARLFLRLGVTAFGGPAAHIAMMEDEVVTRRRWLAREKFLDLLGATNLIPGPNSTEMAIHIGYLRAGWAGLVVAGTAFILPAAVLVTAIAWAYVKFGRLPASAGLLYGVKPVIIAIILQALWRFGATALKTGFLITVGLAALGLSLLGVHELAILFGAGLVVGAARHLSRKRAAPPSGSKHLLAALVLPVTTTAAVTTAAAATFSLWSLFLFFLKVGAVLFGSGYVLLTFLRADLVERWGWLTEAQLLDAIAVGQVTPGPVFTTATFIGYVLGGMKGAAVATLGIFLPAFFFVAISGPLVPRLRQSELAGAALDGINVASVALMALVTWRLGRASIVDLVTAATLAVSLVCLIRFRLNSVWLVLGGALVGLVAFA